MGGGAATVVTGMVGSVVYLRWEGGWGRSVRLAYPTVSSASAPRQ